MSQKNVVFNAIISIVGEARVNDNNVKLSTEERKMVAAVLVEATINGDVVINGKNGKNYDPTTKDGMENIGKYWPGTINNWLRKDTRLNGGSPYVTKNPGSRTGVGNKQIKATRGFIKQLEAKQAQGEDVTELLAKAKASLDKQLAEEAAKKAKTEVNIDDLPAELRDLAI